MLQLQIGSRPSTPQAQTSSSFLAQRNATQMYREQGDRHFERDRGGNNGGYRERDNRRRESDGGGGYGRDRGGGGGGGERDIDRKRPRSSYDGYDRGGRGMHCTK
jgi:hypothetical protein